MIIGVSIISLLPRILPVALLSQRELPTPVKTWLSFVAPAVLGALTAVSVFAPQGEMALHPRNLYLWAFLPTLIVAVKSKNLFYTLLCGIFSLAILGRFFGS